MNKDILFPGQPVYSQLLSLIPNDLVSDLASKYDADRYCKYFFAYDHLVTMLYSGFFQCTGLRELITGLQANADRLSHLGMTHTPRKSTLADANIRRSAEFFGAIYDALYKKHFCLPDSRVNSKEDRLFIIDSTTITLFSNVMKGAGSSKLNGKKKGGVKAHMMINAEHDLPAFVDLTEAKENDRVFLIKVPIPDYSTVVMDMGYIKYKVYSEWSKRNIRWITRLNNGAVYRVIADLPLCGESVDNGVLKDQYVMLGRASNKKQTPLIKARLVEYWDAEKRRTFTFVTNDMSSDPYEISQLYKRRWQIEILFKRIKQRYPLKYFLGDNPNAIKIQIWTALICDLLVKIVQKQVKETGNKTWCYATLAGMLRQHLMNYISLIPFLLDPDKALLKPRPISVKQLSMFPPRGAVF